MSTNNQNTYILDCLDNYVFAVISSDDDTAANKESDSSMSQMGRTLPCTSRGETSQPRITEGTSVKYSFRNALFLSHSK